MAEPLIAIGPSFGLRFELAWSKKKANEPADRATIGNLLAWVGEDLVWGGFSNGGDPEPLEWNWIELLEFLARNWIFIEYESGYPFGLQPVLPLEVAVAAEERWQSMPERLLEKEERTLFAFKETHNLAAAIHGYFLPPLWVVREQGVFSVSCRRNTIRRPVREVLTVLTELGDSICARIHGLHDKRSKMAVHGWENRRQRDPWELAEIATGLSREELQQVAKSSNLQSAFGMTGEFEITEELDLVGMTRGHLASDQIASVIAQVKAFPRTSTPALDTLSMEAEHVLGTITKGKPWSQGYELAQWYRAKQSVTAPSGRVDPEAIISGLSVKVSVIDFGNEALDAIACWGPHYGPAVLLNSNSHNADNAGKRATLAHELCHLLADRREALPLGDVINGNVPHWFEQRANAFAAELLLPRHIAMKAATEHQDIIDCVRELTSRFEVSKEIASWQIRNSGFILSEAAKAKLQQMVRNQRHF
jgi:Zn-dependent peptidase ImmA (M78 family)